MPGTQHTCCFKTVCALYMCVLEDCGERSCAKGSLTRAIPIKRLPKIKNSGRKQGNIKGNAEEQKAGVCNHAPTIPDK